MNVSKNRDRELGPQRFSPDEEAALGWLQRELAWEQVLERLRRRAGVEAPPVGSGPPPQAGRGQERAA